MSSSIETIEHGGSDADARPAPAGGRAGDRVFRGLSAGAGILLLLIMAAIAAFLIAEAIPALRANTADFFTTTTWDPDGEPSMFGIAALAFGTVLTSVIALIIATPVAVGVALFISHYAPRRLAAFLGYVVDLLAAVPSVVYGLWGLVFLVPGVQPVWQWLHATLGFIPLFSADQVAGKSVLTGSLVLAIMILPIIAAVSREVFLQAPDSLQEAALGLGATRWEMIRMTVLPFGKSGVVSAAMLGLGRALGETIAVAMVLPAAFTVSFQLLNTNGNSIAANIANTFAEAAEQGRGALIASGLVLFVITLAVNMAARLVVARGRDGA